MCALPLQCHMTRPRGERDYTEVLTTLTTLITDTTAWEDHCSEVEHGLMAVGINIMPNSDNDKLSSKDKVSTSDVLHYLLLTTYCLLLTTCCLLCTTYYLLLTADRLILATAYLPVTTDYYLLLLSKDAYRQGVPQSAARNGGG